MNDTRNLEVMGNVKAAKKRRKERIVKEVCISLCILNNYGKEERAQTKNKPISPTVDWKQLESSECVCLV